MFNDLINLSYSRNMVHHCITYMIQMPSVMVLILPGHLSLLNQTDFRDLWTITCKSLCQRLWSTVSQSCAFVTDSPKKGLKET